MRKYTPAPKEVIEALKHSIPVTKEEALGDGWKRLPVFPPKARKSSEKANKYRRHKVGECTLEVPAGFEKARTEDIIALIESYFKKHRRKR